MNKNQSWIFDHSLNIGLLSELRLLQAFRSSEQNVLCFLSSQFLAMKLGLKLMEKENYGQVYIHISIRNTPFKAWHLLIVITNTTIFCNIPSLSMDHTFQVLLWFFFSVQIIQEDVRRSNTDLRYDDSPACKSHSSAEFYYPFPVLFSLS